jgi:hypothetical protein
VRVLVQNSVLTEVPSLASFLRHAGLTAISGDDADELLELATAETPQIVVLDEDLPGGGIALVRRLRVEAGATAAAVLLRTRRAMQAPLDGVICVLKGDGAQATLAALTRLLLVPVRAAVHAHVLVEAPRRALGAQLFEAQAIDVSVSGVKMKTAQVLRPGDAVNLAFVLAPGEPLVITPAKVIRLAGEERGQHLYGVEFVDLRRRDREAIQACVDRRIEPAPVPQPSQV